MASVCDGVWGVVEGSASTSLSGCGLGGGGKLWGCSRNVEALNVGTLLGPEGTMGFWLVRVVVGGCVWGLGLFPCVAGHSVGLGVVWSGGWSGWSLRIVQWTRASCFCAGASL